MNVQGASHFLLTHALFVDFLNMYTKTNKQNPIIEFFKCCEQWWKIRLTFSSSCMFYSSYNVWVRFKKGMLSQIIQKKSPTFSMDMFYVEIIFQNLFIICILETSKCPAKYIDEKDLNFLDIKIILDRSHVNLILSSVLVYTWGQGVYVLYLIVAI